MDCASDRYRASYPLLFPESFSEWLDVKEARDDARGLESEAYTFAEAEARRKESHT
jgi:hypothetical protein